LFANSPASAWVRITATQAAKARLALAAIHLPCLGL